MANPHIMRLATRQAVSHPTLTRLALTLVGGLPPATTPTTTDRLAAALTHLTPTS